MAWGINTDALNFVNEGAKIHDYFLAIYEGETLIEEIKLTPENVYAWDTVNFDVEENVTVDKVELLFEKKPGVGSKVALFRDDTITEYFEFGGILEIENPKLNFIL